MGTQTESLSGALALKACSGTVEQVTAFINHRRHIGTDLTSAEIVAIARNPLVTGVLLGNAVKQAEYFAWTDFASHFVSEPLRLDFATAMLDWCRYGIGQKELAQVTSLPTDFVLRILKSKKYSDVRSEFARYTNSVEVIQYLARDSSSYVRRNLIANPHTPKDVIERLARDRNPEVRAAVAAATSDENLLRVFANDRDWTVVSEVAGNARTSRDVLLQVAGYNHDGILAALLKREHLDTDIADFIADSVYDNDYDLHVMIVKSKHASLNARVRIATTTKSGRVRRDLLDNLTMSEVDHLMEHGSDEIKAMLSKSIVRTALV